MPIELWNDFFFLICLSEGRLTKTDKTESQVEGTELVGGLPSVHLSNTGLGEVGGDSWGVSENAGA